MVDVIKNQEKSNILKSTLEKMENMIEYNNTENSKKFEKNLIADYEKFKSEVQTNLASPFMELKAKTYSPTPTIDASVLNKSEQIIEPNEMSYSNTMQNLNSKPNDTVGQPAIHQKSNNFRQILANTPERQAEVAQQTQDNKQPKQGTKYKIRTI